MSCDLALEGDDGADGEDRPQHDVEEPEVEGERAVAGEEQPEHVGGWEVVAVRIPITVPTMATSHAGPDSAVPAASICTQTPRIRHPVAVCMLGVAAAQAFPAGRIMADKASPASAHPCRNRAAANTHTRRALSRVHAGDRAPAAAGAAGAAASTGTTVAPAAG